MQTFFDAISHAARDTRKKYHLTLGELIERLKKCDSNLRVIASDDKALSNSVNSYRGHYADLCIEPSPDNSACTVGELLKACQSVLDVELQGYKGGDYLMEADTPLWIGYHSSSTGLAAIDASISDGVFLIETKYVD